MSSRTFLIASGILLIVAGIVFTAYRPVASIAPSNEQILSSQQANQDNFGKLITVVSYTCDAGKTVMVGYFEGKAQPVPSPGQPPTPGGIASLTFNDGTEMTLHQTLSADGARYANPDESFVFWSKGMGAMVLQNGNEKDYTNCVGITAPASATTTAT